MRDFLRVLAVARRHWSWAVAATLSMAVVAATTVFTYNLIRPVYDELLQPAEGSLPAAVGERQDETGLVAMLDEGANRAESWVRAVVGRRRSALLALILGAVAVKNLFAFLSRYAMAQLGLATIRDLRDLLFASIVVQSPAFFARAPSGTLMARVLSDVQLIHEALAERFGDLVQDSLLVVVLIAYAFSLSPRMALATVVVAPLLVAPLLHFSKRLRRRSREAQEEMGELAATLDESLKGVRVVQAFTAERFAMERFSRATRRLFLAHLRARMIQAANAPAMEVMGALGAVALIAYASAEIGRGGLTLGDFSAFLVAVYGAYNPVKRLNKLNLSLQQAVVAAQRIFEVVDAEPAIRDLPRAGALESVADGIRFEAVGFAYDDQRWVLRGFDLAIPRGHTVALVGPSGAGKTTVARMIPRFWDVQEGAVLVGGKDVRDLTLRSLRASIGLVTQDTVLFNDTVRANIAFGVRDAEESAVIRAAEAAFAHDFICRLPRAYDTVVGEDGSTLSGGQRQRLAIARALFKDAPILILDEATSALDPEAEQLVQQALANVMAGRTTLVIAHRLSTVVRAHAIVVLAGGKVLESGNHADLLAAGGMYRRMVEMHQLKGEE